MDDGEDIQVWLYVEAEWPPQTLVQLYAFMQESPPPSLFWREGVQPTLNGFIRWLTEPGRLVFFPMLVSPTLTLDNIIGMCTVDEIDEQQHRAAVHFWVRKKFWWRRRPLQAAHKVLELLFTQAPMLQVLICRMNSHNRLGVKFMKQLGVHIIGELPDWYKHGERYYPALFGYIHRRDIELHSEMNAVKGPYYAEL